MRDQRKPYVKVDTVPNPAAGAEWTYRCDGIGVRRILSVAFTLTTAVAVGNRFSILIQSDGTNDYLYAPCSSAQTASLTELYSAFTGSPQNLGASGVNNIPAPTDGFVLLPGHTLRSSTVAIAAADQYSAIALLTVVYPTGPGYRMTPDIETIDEDYGGMMYVP